MINVHACSIGGEGFDWRLAGKIPKNKVIPYFLRLWNICGKYEDFDEDDNQNEKKYDWENFRFIGEESTAGGVKCELTKEPTWIIDPIGFFIFHDLQAIFWPVEQPQMGKFDQFIIFRWDDQLHPQQPKHLHYPGIYGRKGKTLTLSQLSSSLKITI